MQGVHLELGQISQAKDNLRLLGAELVLEVKRVGELVELLDGVQAAQDDFEGWAELAGKGQVRHTGRKVLHGEDKGLAVPLELQEFLPGLLREEGYLVVQGVCGQGLEDQVAKASVSFEGFLIEQISSLHLIFNFLFQ